MNDIERRLKANFSKFNIQPVGQGFIDCICPKENIIKFIDSLEPLGVKIDGFTWWCFANGNHLPCGSGGPKNKYGNGFFSEILTSGLVTLNDNASYRHYFERYPKSDDYKDCYLPAFWLGIPR